MVSELPRLSLVCVFNDPAVRRECLDSSLVGEDPEAVEYLPVDNVGQRFTSAGAALNHGVRLASHEVVVLVHQDVHLHSVTRLREVARHLRSGSWGLIGACGTAADGTVVGTVRDRVQLIGLDAATPRTVDSVDEVLFMVTRQRLLEQPLSEDPELSWHAYAVEYGARMRRAGLGVGAASLAITHNSMSVNLDKLDVAHAFVGSRYPELLPLRTTCGVIAAPSNRRLRNLPVVRSQGWRRRWLTESLLARRTGRRSTSESPVLADIRMDVDDLRWADRPLRVVNLDPHGTLTDSEVLALSRGGRPVQFQSCPSLAHVAHELSRASDDDSFLVTNLRPGDVAALTALLPPRRPSRLGVHEQDVWLLVGPVAGASPAAWSRRRAVPLLAGR